ncbi:MAG: ferrochelatase, partial [Bacteroidota bacterium]
FHNSGIKNVIVIPLYPQASYSTTTSVESDARKVVTGFPDMKLNFIHEFYHREGFVKFWAKTIHDHIIKNNYRTPYLVFSAHSIPVSLVKNGDTYQKAIEECSKKIAKKSGYDYEVAYQSGMSRGKWIGPDVKERLKALARAGMDEIVLVPISFINENMETLYDMDMDIIPFGKNALGIKKISRANIPDADPLFIQLLADIIRNEET